MKVKYLFPVLAGLAMVSCSQEDDFLSTNVPGGQVSPITFTVTKENGAATKAWDELVGEKPHFDFEQGDLMSLWNGMGLNDVSNPTRWNALGQNAVYEGYGTGESLKFTTRSMVNAGSAIMVYPADTAFYNAGLTYSGEVYIRYKLETEQKKATKTTKATKDRIPYISDVMNIGVYNGNKEKENHDNTAGYGRNYDVMLRPVGSVFGMKLNVVNGIDYNVCDVEPLGYTKVAMDNNSQKLFTNEIQISFGATASALKDIEDGKYDHMVQMSDVEPVADAASATISTEDIAGADVTGGLPVAYFSLLPMANAAEADNGVKIEVQTTYGKVTVANDASAGQGDKGPLQNNAGTLGTNLKANLGGVIDNIYKATTGSKFGTENQGRVVRYTLTFDLSTLDMNGLEIRDSKHLIDVLKVYSYLGIEGDVRLVLAGAEGKFTLTKAAIEALKLYNSGHKIALDVATKSQAIVLTDAGLETLEDESVEFTAANGNTAAKVNVYLAAGSDWTLDQSYKSEKVNEIYAQGSLTFTNQKNAKESLAHKLYVYGAMDFEGTNFTTGQMRLESTSVMTVATGQTVTLGGDYTSNYGKIDNNYIITATGIFTNSGYIDNKFELSVVVGSQGSITNVGTIHNDGASAVTYITNNKNVSNTGRIILTDRDDEVSIKNAANEGYIVYKATPESGSTTFTYNKEQGDVFNWLTVEGASNVTLNENVTYLELVGNPVTVNAKADEIKVTDLFVKSSMRLLGSDNKITATNIYVQDYILHAGGLTGQQKRSYTSGVNGEAADNTTFANGEIRTVSSN